MRVPIFLTTSHPELRILALATGVLTLLIFLAPFHWALEVLSHFRLPAAIFFLSLAYLLYRKKDYKAAVGVAICLFLQLVPLSQHFLPFTKDSRVGTGPEFKVVSFNVLTRNSNHQEVLSFLKEEDADFVGLQEISQEWVTALEPLRELYPHVIEYPRSDNFGILFLSKHPIMHENHEVYPEIGIPFLHMKMDWKGQPLTIITIHPLPPVSPGAARSRNNTFEQIQEEIANDSNPLLVMGDFNCSSYSPDFKNVSKGLRDSGRGRGYQATWRRWNPLLGIPIDHILYRDSLVCRNRSIGPKCGSDHSPIIAIFQAAKSS